MPQFTPHQDAALKAASDWLKSKPGKGSAPQVFRLFGFAGTGKVGSPGTELEFAL